MSDRELINAALGWEPVDENIEKAIREHYPIINEAYKTLQKSTTPERGLRAKCNVLDEAMIEQIEVDINDLCDRYK